MNRKYRVAVYNNHGGSKIHTNRPIAYLRYFTSGKCIHQVIAANGLEAKRLAIDQHNKNYGGMCSHMDDHCKPCPGLGTRVFK